MPAADHGGGRRRDAGREVEGRPEWIVGLGVVNPVLPPRDVAVYCGEVCISQWQRIQGGEPERRIGLMRNPSPEKQAHCAAELRLGKLEGPDEASPRSEKKSREARLLLGTISTESE